MSAPLPLPLGEVPPQGAERALSVTAKAVTAPPKGRAKKSLNTAFPNYGSIAKKTAAPMLELRFFYFADRSTLLRSMDRGGTCRGKRM